MRSTSAIARSYWRVEVVYPAGAKADVERSDLQESLGKELRLRALPQPDEQEVIAQTSEGLRVARTELHGSLEGRDGGVEGALSAQAEPEGIEAVVVVDRIASVENLDRFEFADDVCVLHFAVVVVV